MDSFNSIHNGLPDIQLSSSHLRTMLPLVILASIFLTYQHLISECIMMVCLSHYMLGFNNISNQLEMKQRHYKVMPPTPCRAHSLISSVTPTLLPLQLWSPKISEYLTWHKAFRCYWVYARDMINFFSWLHSFYKHQDNPAIQLVLTISKKIYKRHWTITLMQHFTCCNVYCVSL